MADSPARTTSGAPGGAERRGCGVVHRTTSESLRLTDLAPPSLQTAAPISATAPQQHNPRKISSFQITSVTVGGRVSADGGEDSADDLDESHADDISRITDLDNETPSRSEDTFSRDDVFYNASASLPLGSAPVIPTSSQYGLAIVGQEASEANDMRIGPGTTIVDVAGDTKPQEGVKESQEHVRNERFKVVKIESTEPFRRGRWMCMDYLDHTTIQQSAPIVVNNNLEASDNNTLTADSGVVINDIQHDECIGANELTNKDLQGPPSVLQIEQTIQKSFPMASPGQSLTQPVNLGTQQISSGVQAVSVQSPPLEIPQQMSGPTMQTQAHAQSMTHIQLQPAPQPHPSPAPPQNVQQMPQSFPQHQLQQVIAQSQGIPQMQQISMHQQIPQQMQQIPNQPQMQQLPPQHMPQNQIPNMQQLPQIPQMQTMQNQNQMQVQNQQSMQQLQMQQMQGQSNPQQMHQIQQAQMTNMTQAHHLQNQGQTMSSQQPQLQHMPSQAQLQAMQTQQMPNHLQTMQISGQVNQMPGAAQQMPQMQTHLHQITSQSTGGQQQVVQGMHPQIQQGLPNVQTQYAPSVTQQPNAQMINPVIPSSQQAMVSQQHAVPQYHTQQSQMNQQGQTLPQEVLANIATSHQGASMTANMQSLPSQQQGSTLPTNLQGMNQQNAIHHMSQQPQSMPQGTIQMMTNTQNMPMSLDANQTGMQMPVADPMYVQASNPSQQLQMSQHIPQAQNMMPQQVPTSAQSQPHLQQQNQIGAMQYVLPQQQGMPNQPNAQCVVSQANMQSVNQSQGNVQSIGQQIPGNMGTVGQQVPAPMMQGMVNAVQNIPMSMQQNLPVSLQGAVHGVATSVVQSQTNMQPNMQANSLPLSYTSQGVVNSLPQNVIPAMSHTNMNNPVAMQNQQMEAVQAISGTSSPVVSLAVNSGAYAHTGAMDGQNFGSPVSAVVSHVVNSLVNSSVGMTGGDSEVSESQGQMSDMGDGRMDDAQPSSATEDESISGLAMALGGGGSPGTCEPQPSSAAASRPASPAQPHHNTTSTSASGTSAVAIDNKIEQAMDLVKSHLMFAVREEVEVLKERIAELMERITQLEVENTYLRAHASQDTLAQLPAAGCKPASLPPAGPPPPAS